MSETSPDPYRPDPFKPMPLPPDLAAAREMARHQDLIDTRYKTFWRRFGAGLVDGLVFLPVLAVAIPAAFYAEFHDAPAVFVTVSIAISVASNTYVVGMHARFGRTLGKMVAGVTVVEATSHGPISLGQALRRSSGDIALGVLSAVALISASGHGSWRASDGGTVNTFEQVSSWSWFGIEMLTFWTNSRRRAFHDLIAGTVVVKTAWLDQLESIPTAKGQ